MRRIDSFEVGLLALLSLLSLWTLGLDVWQAHVHHLVWTGSENVYQEDGMQSMTWIQGILHHGASPDLWVLGSTPSDYFQPLLGISAGLAALGAAPYVALLVWKPVAVLAIFLAARAYVYRLTDGRWARRVALALALFFGWGTIIGDSWIVWWSWGYPFALIGLACALGALLAYARDRSRERIGLAPGLLGALASWLHPWQGEILVLVLLGAEALALLGRERTPWRGLVKTLVLTALPLLYFGLLVQLDPVWQREREAALFTYPFSHIASCFWPLALPALLAYRLRPASFLALTTRIWPFAALAVFGFSEWKGSGSTHAFLGITIPLALLAVEGVRSLPWRRLALALPRAPVLASVAVPAVVLALTVPAGVKMLRTAKEAVRPKTGNASFITHAENAALAYLARDRQPGGVLTRFYLGMVLPARTARNTYVGDCYWSEPRCAYRSSMSDALLLDELAPAAARTFVRSTGARFVLGDCRSHDLTATLAPLLSEVRRFGCATLYVLR